jgi:hypothetical protein
MKRLKVYIILSLSFLLMYSCKSVKEVHQPTRERIDLSGMWMSEKGVVKLPGTMDESRLPRRNTDTTSTSNLTRLYPYLGVATYKKEIIIPPSFTGKHIILFMERTKPSTVWIDGDSVASQSHIQVPHQYDLTNRLSLGKHLLEIKINNNDSVVPKEVRGSHAWTDATQTNWNGILGDFYLEATGRTYIKNISVHPNLSNNTALIHINIYSDASKHGTLDIEGHSWNTPVNKLIPKQTFCILNLNKGENKFDFTVDMGKDALRWSEFDPAMYKLIATYKDKYGEDEYSVNFGMREFTTNQKQFQINGLTIILRGTHDGCVFPLTGYAPMNEDGWYKYFKALRDCGFNQVRFHSWTPPMAAFREADKLGLYLQTELPIWCSLESTKPELTQWLKKEGEAILETYGNSPSFTQMALGNELGGEVQIMRDLVSDFKAKDNRHLYSFGSNNFLGYKGYQKGEDYFVTCRVGGDRDSVYSAHVRASFAFADAHEGGILNGMYPNTMHTYSKAIGNVDIPVISHESGQYQVYPDYNQIKKYKGVLYPYNLMIFQKRLVDHKMAKQAEDFHKATASFAALCYKADIEQCLRTPLFGGFQMLDIKDYPGQGTALVGLYDAFMDNKGAITAKEISNFCNDVVPLAEFSTYCWSNNQNLKSDFLISNYSAKDISAKEFKVELVDEKDSLLYEKSTMVSVPQGKLLKVDDISFPLNIIKHPQEIKLTLSIDNYHNSYKFWVYPQVDKVVVPLNIKLTNVLDESVKAVLNKGGKVLLVPSHKDILDMSVGGLFTPDYWNYAMFKSISEANKREVSPGTLSLLMNPKHPLFKDFPTESYSNWQWWSIAKASRPFILDAMSEDYLPIIQSVDNVERNHKLGILFEFKVGKGSLMVCTCDLKSIQNKPEGKQFYQSILNYMESKEFLPSTSIAWNTIYEMMHHNIQEPKIAGVKNITSYK